MVSPSDSLVHSIIEKASRNGGFTNPFLKKRLQRQAGDFNFVNNQVSLSLDYFGPKKKFSNLFRLLPR